MDEGSALLYSVVVKHVLDREPPFPLCEMVTTDHSAISISSLLLKFFSE
jgi:hypothetical protein